MRIEPHGRTIPVRTDQPVLEAALSAGLNLPHSCKSGHCSSCRARLRTARVRSPALTRRPRTGPSPRRLVPEVSGRRQGGSTEFRSPEWTQGRLDAFLTSPRGPNGRSAVIRTLGEANRVYWALKHMKVKEEQSIAS